MAQKLTYTKAFEELEGILNEMQSDNIPIDKLADKVKRSKEIIRILQRKSEKNHKNAIDKL